ncbi:MAG: response regulator [Methyloligellaceae bacterium]
MQDIALDNTPVAAGRVLAVEDDQTTLIILTALLEELNYEVIEATNGIEALGVIEREAEKLDVIVLDKHMPEMDGLEVVKQLKNDPRASRLPVIMVTGSDSPDEFKEGIDAGVFYYLTKPYEDDVFASVLTSAMKESERRSLLKNELKKHQSSFNFIDQARFTIKSIEDAEDLAHFIAYCFPNPEIALPGLADLLVNAVEHGNLEIGYEEKTNLLKTGKWREEVRRRENAPEYCDRQVKVTLMRNSKETRVVITDEGSGFNWEEYMDIDPSRALHNHGRGIAQANKISFDELNYNEAGNEVTVASFKESDIEW